MIPKVMILGAGIYQLPLIKKAKELGYYVIVVSIEGNYPGFEFADKIYFKDTTDYHSILNIAESEKIEAICTIGTDVAVRSIGHVCDFMNIPGPSSIAAIISTDKKLMKEAFVKAKVNTPKFTTIQTFSQLENFFYKQSSPIVVKSVDRSGSKGITKVTKEKQLRKAFQYAMKNTYKDYIIAEEFIQGKKITVETAIVDGILPFIMPNGDILHKGRIDIPIGHFTPAPISINEQREVEKEVKKAIAALSINNCGVNIDIVLKDEKAYIIEVGARGGGSNLAELVSNTYDIDYYHFILDIAFNKINNLAINMKPKYNAACEVLCAPKSGIIHKFELNSYHKNLIEFHRDYKIGENVKKFEVGSDRIGHIIVKCDINENAHSILQQIKKSIKIEIQ